MKIFDLIVSQSRTESLLCERKDERKSGNILATNWFLLSTETFFTHAQSFIDLRLHSDEERTHYQLKLGKLLDNKRQLITSRVVKKRNRNVLLQQDLQAYLEKNSLAKLLSHNWSNK